MGTVGGSSGVTFVARRLNDPALDALLPSLDGVVAQDALGTAAGIRGLRGVSVSTFDQISGLAGVLLCASPISIRAPVRLRALRDQGTRFTRIGARRPAGLVHSAGVPVR